MGNKPMQQQQQQQQEREGYLVKVVPPLDPALVRWLSRDLEHIYGFAPKNPRAIKPPDHYIEHMRLNGSLNLDLDDPELAHLFK